jgi:hypothetical protein
MSRFIAASIGMLVLGFSSSAYAVGPYTYFYFACDNSGLTETRADAYKWPGTSYSLRLKTADFPTTGASAIRRSALLGAMAEWNEAPQNFTISAGSGTTGAMDNGVSEAYANNGLCPAGAPACAPIWGSCSAGIDEADVIFVTNQAFADTTVKANLAPYGGANRDLRGLFIHELGHTLALAHNAIYYNIMGDDIDHHITQGPNTHNFVGGYGARAAALHYGYRSNARQELTVSHWRRSGTLQGGEYSNHTPTRLYNSSNNLIGTSNSCAGVAGSFYNVTRGQTVKPGFAFENEGGAPQTGVGVTFYLSPDDTIGPPDQQFATTAVDISRGPADNVLNSTTLESGETKIPVVIPSRNASGATISGRFFIGVHIDRGNAIAEVDDDPFGNTVPPSFTGNSSYLQQRICILP